jgi:hypothetical protein
VTPVLSAVYDELLARASRPPFQARADAMREQFLRRTAAVSVGGNVWAMIAAKRGVTVGTEQWPLATDGLVQSQDHRGGRSAESANSNADGQGASVEGEPDGGREARTLASWDEALTRGGLALELAGGFSDPSERALVRVVGAAQRGIFRLYAVRDRVIAIDAVGGAEFLMLARDNVVRAVPEDTLDSTLFDGRVVAASDGCSMLPGVIFHPPGAIELVDRIVQAGKTKGLGREQLCDALLRMQDAFFGSSRVKLEFAYNPDALSHILQHERSTGS